MQLLSNGKVLTMDSPAVMGIINATPDSFYTKDLANSFSDIQKRVNKMVSEGADILDIGGMSTQPYSEPVSVSEEIDRVAPIVEWIRTHFPSLFISVDTYRHEVVEALQSYDIDIVNDISGASLDPQLLDVVSRNAYIYVASHIQGTPSDMQTDPVYTDINSEVKTYFQDFHLKLKAHNIRQVILDPGFGFGKTVRHNFQLLDIFKHLAELEIPMMAGISRKSMVWKTLGKTPKESLSGTIAAHTIALQNGAHILRVHDVAAARDTIQIIRAYEERYN